jgi:hypothetical protein
MARLTRSPGVLAPSRKPTPGKSIPSVERMSKRIPQTRPILTVGHSTRTIEEFIALLAAHEVKQLVDVRTIPRSRHNPQFNSDQLAPSLSGAGIRYLHMGELGGLRHAQRDSINAAWRNLSFRGYADYMQTPEFEKALDELMRLAQKRRTAIMCAEAVPWRCHRSLIADALVARGVEVQEITSQTRVRPHTLTPWARVEQGRITYPAENANGAMAGRTGSTTAPGKGPADRLPRYWPALCFPDAEAIIGPGLTMTVPLIPLLSCSTQT